MDLGPRDRSRLEPLSPDFNFYELVAWTESLQDRGPLLVNALERFAIGVYQVNGNLSWKAASVGNQSAAAAILHFMCVIHEVGLNAEQYMDENIYNTFIKQNRKEQELSYPQGPGPILEKLTKAQQQVFYFHQKHRSDRARRRFNAIKLAEDLANLCGAMASRFCLIDNLTVREAFVSESKIITGDLN